MKKDFVLPQYGERSLVEVPNTILSLFGVTTGRPILPDELYLANATGAKKVVLFFVDGLGFNQMSGLKDKIQLFDLLDRHGLVNPITTVFPSTTAAGLVTAHSGLTPQEHGLFEWSLFFEELDMVIETIPFKPYKTNQSDTLLASGGKPSMLYDGETVYEKLAHHGVPSFVFTKKGYASSAFSTATLRGSNVVPFSRGSDLMVRLRTMLREIKTPAYFFVYWDQVDATEHEFGPFSREHIAELNYFSYLITDEFLWKLNKKDAKDTCIFLTADHGQVKVESQNILQLDDYIDMDHYMLKNKLGLTIVPVGSARDVFLFVEQEKLDEAMKILTDKLSEKAMVIPIWEAIKQGLFGNGEPKEKFLRRSGNILILPHRHGLLVSKSYRKDLSKLSGTHGGLSSEEMIIPFCSARLSDLVLAV